MSHELKSKEYYARQQQELYEELFVKEASVLGGAIAGGLLGAGVGYSRSDNKNKMRNALLGAGAGGVLGAGAGSLLRRGAGAGGGGAGAGASTASKSGSKIKIRQGSATRRADKRMKHDGDVLTGNAKTRKIKLRTRKSVDRVNQAQPQQRQKTREEMFEDVINRPKHLKQPAPKREVKISPDPLKQPKQEFELVMSPNTGKLVSVPKGTTLHPDPLRQPTRKVTLPKSNKPKPEVKAPTPKREVKISPDPLKQPRQEFELVTSPNTGKLVRVPKGSTLHADPWKKAVNNANKAKTTPKPDPTSARPNIRERTKASVERTLEKQKTLTPKQARQQQKIVDRTKYYAQNPDTRPRQTTFPSTTEGQKAYRQSLLKYRKRIKAAKLTET